MRTLIQVAWLGLVLAGVVTVSIAGRERGPDRAVARAAASGKTELVALPAGGQGLVDARGEIVPIKPYRRIASGSSVADGLLLALAEPERIVALTHYGRTTSRYAHLYGDRHAITGAGDLERLRAWGVDLLLIHHFGAPSELARVREAGIAVFNLGEMRGVDTLLPNIETVATLLGDRARGRTLAASFERRMRAVAVDIPPERRKRAAYVSAYAGQLLGGAARTSYHDVLTAAGLIDASAEKYRDFPRYDPEQLLELDPEIVVTPEASAPMLCRVNGLDHLRACARGGRGVIALSDSQLSDPGLGMLDTAEALREQVYGRSRTRQF
jgi:iron complex transport system substrate-binding protein